MYRPFLHTIGERRKTRRDAGMGRRGCPRSAALLGHPLSARATVVHTGRIPTAAYAISGTVERVAYAWRRFRYRSQAVIRIGTAVITGASADMEKMDLRRYDYRDYLK